MAYLLPKSSVFFETFNYIIGNTQEAGLITKWDTDFMYAYELQNNVRRNQFLKNGQVILTLKHLQISFLILAFGLAISFLIFLVELWLGRKKLQVKKNIIIKIVE